jgi:hypothetical protein
MIHSQARLHLKGARSMTVSETMLGRLKKLLREKFDVKTGAVTEASTLGASPIGFEDLFIQTEFRIRLNEWFADLIAPFPSVAWGGGTTMSDIIKDILKRSKVPDVGKATGYRTHVRTLATNAFDNAAGQGATSAPVAKRREIQEGMNVELASALLTKISLGDLAGTRATILSNVTDRMTI